MSEKMGSWGGVMAKSHNAQFRLPTVDGDIIVLDTDDIVVDDPSEADAEPTAEPTADPAQETAQPTAEIIATPTPGEILIAENQVAGFGLVSTILLVICGLLAGIEVFKLWTRS